MKIFSSIFLMTLLCCLLCCESCAVFGSENWVEVVRFEGVDSTQTDLFTCDFSEWRIRWEFTPSVHSIVMPDLVEFSVTTYAQEDFVVINRIETIKPIKEGISVINDSGGDFYMKITTMLVDDYTIVIEQNTNSVPKPEVNWVEVARFAGAHTNQQTSSFVCNCPEWRIKWEFNATHDAFHFPDLLRFSITTFSNEYPSLDYTSSGQDSNYAINQIEAADLGKSGIKIIENQVGSFFLVIEASYVVDGYTVVIEQNVDSIPEFSSWLFLPIFLVCTFSIIVLKKKLFSNR